MAHKDDHHEGGKKHHKKKGFHKFKKGSKEAKAFMAKIRGMRKGKKK